MRGEGKRLRTSFFSRVELKPESACKRSLRSHLPEGRW